MIVKATHAGFIVITDGEMKVTRAGITLQAIPMIVNKTITMVQHGRFVEAGIPLAICPAR